MALLKCHLFHETYPDNSICYYNTHPPLKPGTPYFSSLLYIFHSIYHSLLLTFLIVSFLGLKLNEGRTFFGHSLSNELNSPYLEECLGT